MQSDRHTLLRSTGPFLIHACYSTAARYGITVEQLVQVALGREFPGAPAFLQAATSMALEALPSAILAAAKEVGAMVDGCPLPRLKGKATEEEVADHQRGMDQYERVLAAWWETTRSALADTWPPPDSYAPPEARSALVSQEPPAPSPEA